jgi:hypothetical protein
MSKLYIERILYLEYCPLGQIRERVVNSQTKSVFSGLNFE